MKRLKTVKQYIWAPLQPTYPFFRWLWIKVGWAIVPDGRQNFHLGYLKPHVSHVEFKKHLKDKNFHHQWFAFVDPDEILGMRKLCEKNCKYQYHVRVFADQEIRGHYEKTPEDYPFDHLHEVDFQDKRDEFLLLFGDLIEIR